MDEQMSGWMDGWIDGFLGDALICRESGTASEAKTDLSPSLPLLSSHPSEVIFISKSSVCLVSTSDEGISFEAMRKEREKELRRTRGASNGPRLPVDHDPSFLLKGQLLAAFILCEIIPPDILRSR